MTQKNPETETEKEPQDVAWIRTAAETEATGYVKNLYDNFKKWQSAAKLRHPDVNARRNESLVSGKRIVRQFDVGI